MSSSPNTGLQPSLPCLRASAQRPGSIAEALLEAHPTWAAPPLWRSEWRNVLCGYLRRGCLSLEQVIALQEQAETLVIGHAVLRLAAGSCCSAYDCEFVAAAQQLNAPLITADRALLQAFPALTRPLG